MPTEIFRTQNPGPVTCPSLTHGVSGPARRKWVFDKSLSAPFDRTPHRWAPRQNTHRILVPLPSLGPPESTGAQPLSPLPKAQTDIQGAAGTKVILTWKVVLALSGPLSPSVAVARPVPCMSTGVPVLPNSGPSGAEEEFGSSDLTHAGEQLETPWVWLPTSPDSGLPGHSPGTHFQGIPRDLEE